MLFFFPTFSFEVGKLLEHFANPALRHDRHGKGSPHCLHLELFGLVFGLLEQPIQVELERTRRRKEGRRSMTTSAHTHIGREKGRKKGEGKMEEN